MLACIVLTFFTIFVLVYFLLVPMILNGPYHTKCIWQPWIRDGTIGHWNSDMRRCAQHVINTMKPEDKQHTLDNDIIDDVMSQNEFYAFMRSCYTP